MRFPRNTLLLGYLVVVVLLAIPSVGQSPNGNINGLVVDPTNHLIVGAEVIAVNDVTGVQYPTKTNNEGIYVLPNLPPGPYRIQVSKIGFKTIIKPDIVLNVQDALSINFTLPIGARFETVTVTGGAPLVNAESAAVSTVVDRQFAENLPMNGRSFQTLIQLTPGVVVTPSTATDGGQFSVNGQRSSANYWMVDGVSANVGVSSSGIPGNGFAGALGSFSALGGTNSLVSVDAMQEFRVLTSSFAPEFGRTPGAQISIVTRSGANQVHGTAFDYVRNDLFDANDWFASQAALPKPRERQNDFGGTFSGPIRRDRVFYFFSYEGLRLRLPQVSDTTVPDLSARRSALPAMQPYLNAFPLPNGPDNVATGVAPYAASYSNPATLDAYSLRIDGRVTDKLSLFSRYDYSPSSLGQRAPFGDSPNVLETSRINTQTGTAGATWSVSPMVVADLRMNYSSTASSGNFLLDNLGGAVPLPSSPFPAPFGSPNSGFAFSIFSLANNNGLQAGRLQSNRQRQINVVGNVSVQIGLHTLKFGMDFRRLSPSFDPTLYSQQVSFSDMASAETGSPIFSVVQQNLRAAVLLHNLGVFAQDTWHATPRLSLTYGVRWDLDFTPSSASGPSIPAVTGYNLTDLSHLALAPEGVLPFKMTYANFAPRLGFAYNLRQAQRWPTVFRGGFGVFYDLATQQVGNAIVGATYPFGAVRFTSGGTFPLSAADALPPDITPGNLALPGEELFAFDPNLRLPYTLEWNTSIEQGLGRSQSVSVSYVGSVGRRLIQTAQIGTPNPAFFEVALVTNASTSNYNALQVQFQRRLSHGLQALASYTWSHSIDTGSGGSWGDGSGLLVPFAGARANRGPSDFDIRNSISTGLTYDIPTPKANDLLNALFGNWSLQSVIQARSAPPVDISDLNFFQFAGGSFGDIRPDVVPGQPLYLFGAGYPGGKAFNPAAFTNPPGQVSTGIPVRQGDVPRNFLRGFGAAQFDFAVHRDFPLHERLKLQFRTEIFNILNHPNFGQPSGAFGLGGFGLSTQMLARSLSGGSVGAGGLSPLYQLGGPRSVQLALKLMF